LYNQLVQNLKARNEMMTKAYPVLCGIMSFIEASYQAYYQTYFIWINQHSVGQYRFMRLRLLLPTGLA